MIANITIDIQLNVETNVWTKTVAQIRSVHA